MADIYTHQAKATKKFGIEFRSQLEAKWAYRFSELKLEWEYIDSPWHDFSIEGIKVEIKPYGRQFFDSAVKRIPKEENHLVLIMGSPEIEPMICILREIEKNTPSESKYNRSFRCCYIGMTAFRCDENESFKKAVSWSEGLITDFILRDEIIFNINLSPQWAPKKFFSGEELQDAVLHRLYEYSEFNSCLHSLFPEGVSIEFHDECSCTVRWMSDERFMGEWSHFDSHAEGIEFAQNIPDSI